MISILDIVRQEIAALFDVEPDEITVEPMDASTDGTYTAHVTATMTKPSESCDDCVERLVGDWTTVRVKEACITDIADSNGTRTIRTTVHLKTHDQHVRADLS